VAARVVRALHPHVGARIALPGGEPLRVHEAVPAAGAAPPGELAERDGKLLWGCGEGALELLTVQPPGGKPMEAGAYLRGHRR
jgi:methionyl-tRNA formyltransferase